MGFDFGKKLAVTAGVIAGFAIAQAPAKAISLVGFDTSNGPSVSATNLDAGVIGGNLLRGSGIAQATGGDFNSNGWTQGGDVATAFANGDFLEFSIAPTAGNELSNLVVEFFGDRSNTGPSAIDLLFSTDGFATNSSVTSIAGVDVGTSGSIQSANISGLFTSEVTFRILGYGATGAGGTFDLEDDEVGGDLYGLLISGDSTPIPTPAMLPGLIGFGMSIVRKQRKGQATA